MRKLKTPPPPKRQTQRVRHTRNGATGLTSFEPEVATLQARAQEMIYEGTEWLTAHQVASRAGVAVGSVRRWKAQRKLFSIWLAGRSVYPAYAFDRVRQWRPLAVVAEVLSAAPEWAPGYTAAFFESTSSFLGGRRPREILSLDPRRAIAAAKFALDTERHPG